MPFITAGAPSLDATVDTLIALDRLGVAGIEVGFPFSDPIADGPVIAASMERALRAGTTVDRTLDAIRGAHGSIECAVIAMVSMSIVHRHGGVRFVEALHGAGFDGLIVPDADTDHSEAFLAAVDGVGLDLGLLVAPTSSPQRTQRITTACRGFVYALARAGLTGASAGMPDVADPVARIREHTPLPIAVGFGISTPEHVRHVVRHADAAIVGSALVKAMDTEPAGAAERAREFVSPLLAACARGA